MRKQTQIPTIHIGICVDVKIEKIWLATFTTEGEQSAKKSCNRQFPQLPEFVFEMFQKGEELYPKFSTWLKSIGIEEKNHQNLFLLLVKAIKTANNPTAR